MSKFVQNQAKQKLRYALIRARKFHHQSEYFPVLIEDLISGKLTKELKDYYGKRGEICTVATGNWHEMTALQKQIESEGEHAWVEYHRTGKQAILKFSENYGTFAKEVRVIGWGSKSMLERQMANSDRKARRAAA